MLIGKYLEALACKVMMVACAIPMVCSSKLASQQTRGRPHSLLHKPGTLTDAGYKLQGAVSPLVGFSISCAPSKESVHVEVVVEYS